MSAPSFPVCINFKLFFFSGENKGVWGQVGGGCVPMYVYLSLFPKNNIKKIQHLLVF